MSIKELERSYDLAVSQGVKPKAIVIINPGNPTGHVLTRECIEKIFKFAFKKRVVVISDEVFQDNVFLKEKEFVSAKKVLSEMPSPYNKLEMFSLHSTSKGLSYESAISGGFFEMSNIDEEVIMQFIKLKSINLCSSTMGQLAVDLMVAPPTLTEYTQKTVDTYNKQINRRKKTLQTSVQIVDKFLKKMNNITTNPIGGSMYAFPRIHLN